MGSVERDERAHSACPLLEIQRNTDVDCGREGQARVEPAGRMSEEVDRAFGAARMRYRFLKDACSLLERRSRRAGDVEEFHIEPSIPKMRAESCFDVMEVVVASEAAESEHSRNTVDAVYRASCRHGRILEQI